MLLMSSTSSGANSTQDFSPIQEMEAVTQILFAHAVNDFQQSNPFITSLLPYYHKTMKAVLYREAYDIMLLGRQPSTTTPVEKHCIRRLQEQVRSRLPAPSASQCLSVLLDPATKQFAQNLLDEGEL